MTTVSKEDIIGLIMSTYIEHFHVQYEDYFSKEHTKGLVQFFFDSIYSDKAVKKVHSTAFGTYAKYKHLLNQKTVEKIKPLISLSNLTKSLDQQVANGIIEEGCLSEINMDSMIPTELFLVMIKKYNTYEDKQLQLELTLDCMGSFFDLSKSFGVGFSLKSAYYITQSMNIGEIFGLLIKGYEATKQISRKEFVSFLDEIKKRENQFLDKIYKKEKSSK